MEIIIKPYLPKIIVESLIFISFPIIIFIGIMVFSSFLLEKLILSIFGLILSFFLIFLYLPLTIGAAKGTKYKIRNDFISKNKIFFSIKQDDIPVSQITNVDYNVSWFLDRIFNTGSVSIYTSGSGGVELSLYGVKNYIKIYDEISSLIDSQKEVLAAKINEKFIKKESKKIITIKPNVIIGTILKILSLFPLLFIGFFYSISFNIIPFSYILILFIIFLIIYIIWMYGNLKKTDFTFYTDKLVYYQGFLSLNKSTIPYERITNINLDNSLINRIFGVSTILIETSGSIISNINIKFVKNGDDIVFKLKEVLREHGRN